MKTEDRFIGQNHPDWPYDPRSDQVFAEQLRDRERVEQDLKDAFSNAKAGKGSESDWRLIAWGLGILK